MHEAETVGDHTLLVSYIALELAARLRSLGLTVDPYRCATMALIHDAHESILGNTSNMLRSSSEWRNIEVDAFDKLGVLRDFRNDFLDYRFTKNLEGIVVHLADKLATLIRACWYRRLGFDTEELVRSYMELITKIIDELPQSGANLVRSELGFVSSWCYSSPIAGSSH